MFLSVRGRDCERNQRTKSRSNRKNVAVVIGLMHKAFTDGLAAHNFAVATPYQSQYDLYRATLIGLKHTYPAATNVQVQKIDGHQGQKARYIILEMVIMNDVIFAADDSRLNVGLTRCRDRLVVVGDADAASIMPRQKARGYLKVISAFRNARSMFFVDPTNMPYKEFITQLPITKPIDFSTQSKLNSTLQESTKDRGEETTERGTDNSLLAYNNLCDPVSGGGGGGA